MVRLHARHRTRLRRARPRNVAASNEKASKAGRCPDPPRAKPLDLDVWISKTMGEELSFVCRSIPAKFAARHIVKSLVIAHDMKYDRPSEFIVYPAVDYASPHR